jgi:hypothetical protein
MKAVNCVFTQLLVARYQKLVVHQGTYISFAQIEGFVNSKVRESFITHPLIDSSDPASPGPEIGTGLLKVNFFVAAASLQKN